jgi:surfeit locus 1 family protein
MKKLIAKISILSCIAILISLGIWQLKRMEYKNNLIKNLEEKLEIPTITLHNMTNLENIYQKINICGQYIENSELFVYYRPNYMLLSVFTIENSDQSIIVARGTLNTQNSHVITDTGYNCITGILLPSEKKPIFMPEYNGTKTKPLLSINSESIEEILSIKLSNIYLLQIPNPKDLNNNDLAPLKIPDPKKIYNPHLGYAITWFALALILIGMWRYRV